MRAFLVLLVTAIGASASSLQVDGIPVRGPSRAVSDSDVRNAVRAVHGKVSRVEVLNADRMHVYFKPIDLGWIAVQREQNRPSDPIWPGWVCNGFGVDDPKVSQFIRVADELYVFPVMTPDEPRRDRKRMRRLDSSARRKLADLLAGQESWYRGGYKLIKVRAEPRNIGVLFRRGRNELVLFFSSSFTSSAGRIEGAFNGRHVVGMLEDDPGKEMERWRRRFAQPELP